MVSPKIDSNEMYRLRWQAEYGVDLPTEFRKFRDNEELFDVSLVCSVADGGSASYSAHQVILAAYSPVFKDLFTPFNKKKDPCIYLKGISESNLSAILDFIYCGSVDVPKHDVSEFLRDAQELQIKGLNFDNEYVNPENPKIQKAKPTSNLKSKYLQKPKALIDAPQHDVSEFLRDNQELQIKGLNFETEDDVNPENPIIQKAKPTSNLKSKYLQKSKALFNTLPKSTLVKPRKWSKSIKMEQPYSNNEVPMPDLNEKPSQSLMVDLWQGDLKTDHNYLAKQANDPLDMATKIRKKRKSDNIPCDECSYIATDKVNLRRHISGAHNMGDGINCQDCGLRFTQKASLSTHIKTIHIGTKKFECQECGYEFNKQSNLDRHIARKH